MMEIVKMFELLKGMNTDTYLKYKYMLQAVSKEWQRAEKIVTVLFILVDGHRPLPIEIKNPD